MFRFTTVVESTDFRRDKIEGMVFDNGSGVVDRFDFTVVPTSLAPTITTGSLSEASFGTDLQVAVHASVLGANEAVLFDPNGGDLNLTGQVFLIVDANGVAGYQNGADYVVQIVSSAGTLTTDNFF